VGGGVFLSPGSTVVRLGLQIFFSTNIYTAELLLVTHPNIPENFVKRVHNFSTHPADRQTYKGVNITSLAEVTTVTVTALVEVCI